jgi:hypothetical protein
LLGDFLDAVGTVPCQALHGLGLRQPLRAAVQMRIEFLNGLSVVVHAAWSEIYFPGNHFKLHPHALHSLPCCADLAHFSVAAGEEDEGKSP